MRYSFILIVACIFISCKKQADWKEDFLGNWHGSAAAGQFSERWTKVDHKIIGTGYEMNKKGDTIFGEKLEIFERDETLVYVAWPGFTHRTEFIGKKETGNRYYFENKQNDFPSVIEYHFNGDKLTIFLSGEIEGKKMKQTVEMDRN